MLLAGLAAREVMRETKSEFVDRPQATAGLSSGEYTALVAAGVLDWQDALRILKARGEMMEKAAALTQQAMCSVAGLERSKVEKLCEQAKEADDSPEAECKIANFLFP